MSLNMEKIDNALADTSVNGDDYTVLQLQQWLGNLGLSKSGNKATLILRLNSVAADKRGKCPEIAKPANVNSLRVDAEESDEEPYEESSKQKQEDSHYEMRNGVLYKKKDCKNILFYVPAEMENHVIYKYHDEMGHVGPEKTVELIQKIYWFPKIREKVTNHIKNCLKCIAFSDNYGRLEGYLHNIPKGTKPFNMLHIDHCGPVDSTVKVKKHILVIVDAFTKFVRLYCTKTTNSEEAIKALLDYFRSYSRPKYIVSDRGSCFTSQAFEKFLTENNVIHIKVATASPQANGQVERVNRSIKPILAKLANNSEWYKAIENVEFVINNTMHKSTGEHPSVMLFGTGQRSGNPDLLKEKLLENLGKEEVSNLKKIRSKARVKQVTLQIYNKKYTDKKRKTPIKYDVGDYVMIKNVDSSIGAPKKLIPKFKGPYKISKKLRNDRYVLEDVDGFQQTQIPYVGTWAVNNIRPWINTRKHKSVIDHD